MKTNAQTICIYHANCADGFGAAWVVRRLCPDAEFYAAKHGESAPETKGKHVVIVDFSYPLDILQDMAAIAVSVLVIDHHKTAQEALASLPYPPSRDTKKHRLEAVFDMNRSGAGLTWDFFYPGQPRPALINHIEDRDLWRFQLEGTREVMANLFSHPQCFDVWDELIAMPVAALRLEGAAIERAQQKELADLLRATQRRMVIAGFEVPAANLPYTKASDAGNMMCAGELFAAIYWDTPTGRSFSLRSSDGGEDVSLIARQYGGGGHRNAAGFNVPFGHELTRDTFESCCWTNQDSNWSSACGVSGWTFHDDEGPNENGMRFCHSCGRLLSIIEPAEDDRS
jgi:oligoribonuclease NrnB/cAMP/cGMP phosphodiesterase (DHH superfamily)